MPLHILINFLILNRKIKLSTKDLNNSELRDSFKEFPEKLKLHNNLKKKK